MVKASSVCLSETMFCHRRKMNTCGCLETKMGRQQPWGPPYPRLTRRIPVRLTTVPSDSLWPCCGPSAHAQHLEGPPGRLRAAGSGWVGSRCSTISHNPLFTAAWEVESQAMKTGREDPDHRETSALVLSLRAHFLLVAPRCPSCWSRPAREHTQEHPGPLSFHTQEHPGPLSSQRSGGSTTH